MEFQRSRGRKGRGGGPRKFNNRSQRSNFYGHRRNNTRFSDSNSVPPRKRTKVDPTALRERGGFEVVESGPNPPHCDHGPCLLLKENKDGYPERLYYTCAIYRNNPELCNFKADVNPISLEVTKQEETHTAEKEETNDAEEDLTFNDIPTAYSSFNSEDTILFCPDCVMIYPNKHACVCFSIEKEKLKYPTQILAPLDKRDGESQFFFSSESLQVILSIIKESKVDGVICLAAPRIFEEIRESKTNVNSFLLDYDKRFAKFYTNDSFAQYSMLVDHFFQENGENEFNQFLKKCNRIMIVIDPPFGLFMKPLFMSIEKLRTRFMEAIKPKEVTFYTLMVAPIFLKKHIVQGDSSLWMSDYRVTYDNHRLFSQRDKTIVRLFTNCPKNSINLKNLDGYKYCKKCQVYVTEANLHCNDCEACTSLDKGRYEHCLVCKKCVKPTYIHCGPCDRCHLKGRCFNNDDFN